MFDRYPISFKRLISSFIDTIKWSETSIFNLFTNSNHSFNSMDFIFPLPPVTTKILLPKVIPLFEPPEVLAVQEDPSDDVKN